VDVEAVPEPAPEELEAIREALADELPMPDPGPWWRAGLPADGDSR
jgi:hypothetical protein